MQRTSPQLSSNADPSTRVERAREQPGRPATRWGPCARTWRQAGARPSLAAAAGPRSFCPNLPPSHAAFSGADTPDVDPRSVWEKARERSCMVYNPPSQDRILSQLWIIVGMWFHKRRPPEPPTRSRENEAPRGSTIKRQGVAHCTQRLEAQTNIEVSDQHTCRVEVALGTVFAGTASAIGS